jgi:hypothetical protein
MQATRSYFSTRAMLAVLLLVCAGCARASEVAPRALQIQQNWQLQPGGEIAGYRILGGLGDVSIELEGGKVYAPFDGKVEPHRDDCVVFSSPEVPAYLLRWCGVRRPKLGRVRQGEAIASANALQFAALRRQPDGKWAMVEPSMDVLEKTLNK